MRSSEQAPPVAELEVVRPCYVSPVNEPQQNPAIGIRALTVAEVLSLYTAGERDFSGGDFPDGSDFSGQSLRDARFDDCFLTGNFHSADLRGASFRRSNVKSSDFRATDLRGASFEDAAICAACFDGAQLKGASFAGATYHSHTFTADELPPTARNA